MKYNILSIDGGGIRGIYSAYILKRISEDFNININKYFDLYVGTSTGSIIAGALASNIEINDIYDLYKNKGTLIFKKNKINKLSFGLIGTKYKKDYLKKELNKIFKFKKMKDIKNNLIITSTDVLHGKAKLFRSNKLSCKDYFIKDCILSSVSAPYFFGFEKINNINYADGGLWANNPSIVGFIEAKYNYKIKHSDINILSIGNGNDQFSTYINGNFLKIFQVPKLINLILNLEAKHLDSLSKIILKDKFFKINMESSNLKIDKVSKQFLNNMERSYQEQKEKIANFFS